MFKRFCKLGCLILGYMYKNRDLNVSRRLLVLPLYTDVHHWQKVYLGDLGRCPVRGVPYEASQGPSRPRSMAYYDTIAIFSSIYFVCFIN